VDAIVPIAMPPGRQSYNLDALWARIAIDLDEAKLVQLDRLRPAATELARTCKSTRPCRPNHHQGHRRWLMNLGGLVPVDRFEIPCSFAKIFLPFLKIPCGLGSHRKAESSPHWEGRLRSATACTRGHPAIHQRDPSVTVTARMVSTEPGAGHGVVLPAVKIIARETKRLGWDDRSLPGRLGIGGAAVGLALFGGQGAGVAALGTAVGVPLWVVFGAGATFLGVLYEEITRKKPNNFLSSY
jgi:hypothetical protein